MHIPQRQPFISVALLFVLGIIVANTLNVSLCWIYGLLAMALLLALSRWRLLALAATGLLIILAGMIKTYDHQQIPADDIVHVAKYFKQKPIRLHGVVDSDVEFRRFGSSTKTVFTLSITEYLAPWGWQLRCGNVLVQSFSETKLRYGDTVEIEGKLHQPFEFDREQVFSYKEYLRERGIYRLLSVKKEATIVVLNHDGGTRVFKWIYQLRERFRQVLREHLSFNEYGLMQAILLGDRSYIPEHIMTLFTHTGTVHILATQCRVFHIQDSPTASYA